MVDLLGSFQPLPFAAKSLCDITRLPSGAWPTPRKLKVDNDLRHVEAILGFRLVIALRLEKVAIFGLQLLSSTPQQVGIVSHQTLWKLS